MNLIRKIINFLGYMTFLCVTVFFLLEIIFRVLPTTSPIDLQRTTSADEILKFEINQTGTFSLGANFYKTVSKKTNNAGFYSDYTYENYAEPDIVVIGDSYIEAAQIQNNDTVGALLHNKDVFSLVYQMGVSGVPLSQYIKMAAYAETHYSPERYVFLIVGNDFDQSLCDYRMKEGTWCFDNDYNLTFIPFKGYQGVRNFARKSAFLRYLVFQVGINWRQLMFRIGLSEKGMEAQHAYAGNVKRYMPQEIVKESKIVIDRFMEELLAMGIEQEVTLVLDGDRQDIYNSRVTNSYFREMRNYTIHSAKLNNIEVIDMEPIFEEDYLKYGKRFDFPTDGHWNERAHNLLASEIMKKLVIK